MLNTTKVEDKYSELQSNLSLHFPFHQSRIKFLTYMIVAMSKLHTVCFERLAEGFESDALVTSRLRRIQRFFASFMVDNDQVAKFLFALLPQQTGLRISIDRTNWQFGKTDINIFMLSICYEGMALPLMWTMLEKRGNSNYLERIALIERFIKLFGKACIHDLVADREFIGDKWFSYLQKERIAFHIRVKENLWLRKPNGERMKASWISQRVPVNKVYHYPKLVYLDNTLVYISIIRLKGNEYLIIASYNNQEKAIENYRDRWQIETMFKAFKTNGFNLEATHLREIERIDKLIALVSIAFIWAYKVGLHKHLKEKSIPIKKHGSRAYSIFKYGMRVIKDALLNPCNNQINQINIICKLLSCT
jgi:hypothetical protein